MLPCEPDADSASPNSKEEEDTVTTKDPAAGAAEGPARSPMSAVTREVLPATPKADLDDVDRELLALLAEDARISQRRLARAVGMSPPAIGDRIARLERLGVVRGYSAVLDWSALGYPGIVFMPIRLATDVDLAAVLDALRAIPELTDLVVVTGGYDLVARFRLRDHEHLQQLLLDRIWPIRGLKRIETILGLGEIVRERGPADVLPTKAAPGADA